MAVYQAPNWNKVDKKRPYLDAIWNIITKNFWLDADIPVSLDLPSWRELPEDWKDVFVKALAGLTVLDGAQGADAMPLISMHEDDAKVKAITSYNGTMEHIHAKSYSKVFITLITSEQITEVLENWAENQPNLQYKANRVGLYYNKLWNQNASLYDRYMAKVANVFLESFLFYSGFFLPVYLKGSGKMTNSGEMINLIMRDEAVHGQFFGVLAQEEFQLLTKEEQERATRETDVLFDSLMLNELVYTKDLYDGIGLTEQVVEFLKYNANRAFMNLGLDERFPDVKINSIVEAGMSIETENQDVFSQKGNSYFKATNVVPITDETFKFD